MTTGPVRCEFPAKRYGWGWGPPVRWQGSLALTALLMLVCHLTEEPPAWRRGDPDQ
jgi:hypothetical protein